MSYCKLVAHGRLTKDIEVATTPSGQAYARFTLACSRSKGKDKEPVTEYVNFVAWRTTAEVLAKYTTKGTELIVEGEYTSYKRQVDGEQYPRVNVEFTVLGFDFCGSKKATDDSAPSQAAPTRAPAAAPSSNDFEELDGDADDLPF